MKTYFRLIDDVNVPNRWHLGEILANGSTALTMWNGESVSEEGSPSINVDNPGVPLAFSLTSFATPVVRTELGRAIASVALTDVQRIPVGISNYKNYEVLNAVRVIECLDESKSEFTKWPRLDHRPDLAGQYRMVTSLQIDPKRVPANANFFRIQGWRIALIVSDDVRAAMEQAGCQGAIFQPVM